LIIRTMDWRTIRTCLGATRIFKPAILRLLVQRFSTTNWAFYNPYLKHI